MQFQKVGRAACFSPNKLIAHCKLQFVEIYWTDETGTTLCRKLQGTPNITKSKVQKKILGVIFWKKVSNFLNDIQYSTGKSFSEALILASLNPQYETRFFIELQEKYKFRKCCVQKLFFVVFILTFKTIFGHNLFWSCIFIVIQ